MRKLLLLSWSCLSTILLFAQSRTITGKVTNKETGVAIPAVTVSVRGGVSATQTREDGTFILVVPTSAKTLIFSSVGYARHEVTIGQSNTMDIGLSQGEGEKLDEVVVVAYGTQVSKKLTGSVGTVKGDELENRPFSSVDQALQGKIPGVQSVAPSGQPGGAQTIRIRGVSSVTGVNDPLWVVDGVPVNTGDFSRLTQTTNALAGINPNDIESVTVLKDAAAAAIYGSRAANGVILVTTKKGRVGKTRLKIDLEQGVADVAFQSEKGKPLSKDEYFALTNEGLTNAGASQAQRDQVLNALGFNTSYNEDWLEHVTRKAPFTNVNVSASGGDLKTTFYTSLGYTTQESPMIGSDFKRYSGNVNMRHKATEKFAISINILGSYTKQNTPTNGGAFRNPVLAGYFLRPTQNAYNADGTVNYSPVTFNQTFNPLAIVEYDRGLFNNIKTVSTFAAEYEIIKNLKFSSKFGLDYIGIEEETYYNPFFGDARNFGGRVFNYSTRLTNWVWTNMLDYHHDFGVSDEQLGLDVKVGYESQKNKQYQISARGEGVPMTTLVTLPAPSTPSIASGARLDFSQVSLFSIAQLNLGTKYSLSGSFRRDGSSRFGPEHLYGDFWSVGGAWNIDQASFFPTSNLINALKLRASYGTSGDNRGITEYEWRSTYAFTTANGYNQQPGSAPGTPGNPDLTWEENKQVNVGLDFSILNTRLSGTVEWYDRKSENLLFNVPPSRTSGFNALKANVGNMENTGWEIGLTGTPVRTRDFTWDISFNISLNKNKVTSLPNNNAVIIAGNLIRKVGYDVNSVNTRAWAGVDPANGNPLWFTDSTHKTTTSAVPSYREIIGSTNPKGFGSFSTTLTFKGISLDAQFNYQYGHLVWDNWGFIMWSDGAFGSLNQIKKQLGRWQKPGDETDIPKYIYGNTNNSNAESSRWYYKEDYIRLRELTLSYQMPKQIIDKIKMSNLMFYVRGNNLWTKAFDEEIPFDPEQGFSGTNNLQVLIQRTLTIGVTIGL